MVEHNTEHFPEEGLAERNMMAMADIGGDLQTTLQRHGLSVRHVTDSAARYLILADDIEDARDGIAHTELLSAGNDNMSRHGRRMLMAV